ncbi:MAG: TIGR03668 family PPOX class F420-dependent oxidoreductase [Dehalococcoidia bacterium]
MSIFLEPWVADLLAAARVGRLGTVSPDGRPHLVPVCYAVVSSGTIAIAIDEKPKSGRPLARLRNITRDPRVSFLVDRFSDDWDQLAWVRLDGQAAVVPGRERPAVLAALRDRYPQYRQMALEALPLILIEAETVTSWRWAGA